ncbi:hypothetical protein JCM10207_006372 [Rhodosporidiobolus poonsookiae]
MSSFRRTTKQPSLPGTRPSPSTGTPLLSTGLASLDDLLGGGLPLAASLLITHDAPSSYADLLLRYWVAQGLEAGHEVAVVGCGAEGGPEGVVKGLMGRDEREAALQQKEDRDDDEREGKEDEKMKIAFRYEGMKQHQTELAAPAATVGTDTYCSTFDLTTTRTLSAADRARLHLIDVDGFPSSSPDELYDALYERIEKLVQERVERAAASSAPPRALRLALSSFGSPLWCPVSPSALYRFLARLSSLSSSAPSFSGPTTVLTFPSYLFPSPSSSSSSAQSPLLTRLTHAVSSTLQLTSFSSSPLLAAQYPRHAGLLSLPKLPLPVPPPSASSPAPGLSLLPPGAKLSLLRSLSGGSLTQGRDNLLAFRVKRRRFVVEALSDEPAEDEEERRKRERRRRVEEANRREREQGQATEVLLAEQAGRVARVRIGSEEEDGTAAPVGAARVVDGPPALGAPVPPSAAPGQDAPRKSAFRKKGVRMGGVAFAGADGGEGGEKQAHESVSRMLHERPDLLDF